MTEQQKAAQNVANFIARMIQDHKTGQDDITELRERLVDLLNRTEKH